MEVFDLDFQPSLRARRTRSVLVGGIGSPVEPWLKLGRLKGLQQWGCHRASRPARMRSHPRDGRQSSQGSELGWPPTEIHMPDEGPQSRRFVGRPKACRRGSHAARLGRRVDDQDWSRGVVCRCRGDAASCDQLRAGPAVGAKYDDARVVFLRRLDDSFPDRVAAFGDRPDSREPHPAPQDSPPRRASRKGVPVLDAGSRPRRTTTTARLRSDPHGKDRGLRLAPPPRTSPLGGCSAGLDSWSDDVCAATVRTGGAMVARTRPSQHFRARSRATPTVPEANDEERGRTLGGEPGERIGDRPRASDGPSNVQNRLDRGGRRSRR